MLDAVCGCVVILSAQFLGEDFSSQPSRLVTEGSNDGMEEAIGGYFRVKYPQWPKSERYLFDWRQLGKEPDPFLEYPYQ
jgi:hypothetical protein